MWMPRQPATLCCSRLPLENLDGGGGGDSCRRLGWFKFTGAYEVPGESQRQTATPGGVAARASRSVAHAEMEGEWRRGGERGVLEECRENEIQQLCDRIRFLLRNFLSPLYLMIILGLSIFRGDSQTRAYTRNRICTMYSPERRVI